MGASAWADSRALAEELKTGAIKLRGSLLGKEIPDGEMETVLDQCGKVYLALCEISESPSTRDVQDPNGTLNTMTAVVLTLHGNLRQLIRISGQLDNGNVADTDLATLSRQQTDILTEVFSAISMYIRLLPSFLELADSQPAGQQGSDSPHNQLPAGENPPREGIA